MARFLQLSDLHVVAPGTRASGVLDTPALLRAGIDHLIGRMDAIGPIDAVLVTGDISDDGNDESYTFARAELMRLGLPLLVVPGNHDRRESMRAAFADTDQMPDTGQIDWVTDVSGALVIGLDTLVEGQGAGRLAEQSLALLADALRDTHGRPVIIAMHHPPLRTGIRFMDAIGLENTAEFAHVLQAFDGPLWVVSGHVHRVYHGQIARHPVSTAPSMCSAFALDLRQDGPVGFMTGPRGCAVIDTGPGGTWTAMTLEQSGGPHAF